MLVSVIHQHEPAIGIPLSRPSWTSYLKEKINYKIFSHPIHLGAINVTYATVPGKLSRKNQTEGDLAEPDVDFVPVAGFLILEEGETAGAIDITILEVKHLFCCCSTKREYPGNK